MHSLGKQRGLNINITKTKHMKINAKNEEPVTINNTALEEVDEFVYLGSKVTSDGNSEKDVHVDSRISKARGAFAALHSVWISAHIKRPTKLRIFKSNVFAVLYGSESLKVTHFISNKLDFFQRRCLRRILRIFWPSTISNTELHQITETTPLSVEIKRRRWRWIGHVNRMEETAIPKVDLRWTQLVGGRGPRRPGGDQSKER